MKLEMRSDPPLLQAEPFAPIQQTDQTVEISSSWRMVQHYKIGAPTWSETLVNGTFLADAMLPKASLTGDDG